MWIFLASECLFFGSLISAYLIFKGRSLVGPYPADVFDIPLTSMSTFVLLMSSLAMVLAVYGAEHGRPRMMKLWLLVTILLGLTFLGFQTYEFRSFGAEGLNLTHEPVRRDVLRADRLPRHPRRRRRADPHSLLIASFRRSGLGAEAGFNVEVAGLYWHFVDIVWIVIFTVIYLMPH